MPDTGDFGVLALRDVRGSHRPEHLPALGLAAGAPGVMVYRVASPRGQRCLVVTDGFYEWKKLDAKGTANRSPRE